MLLFRLIDVPFLHTKTTQIKSHNNYNYQKKKKFKEEFKEELTSHH